MRPLIASLTLVALLGPAAAQAPVDTPPASENGRFQMTPSGNGFLRLDTRTGAVSLCSVTGASAECRAAADDRAALMAEIDRLSKRVAELEGAPARSLQPARPSTNLPNKEEFGRAMDMAEDFMRRMMRIMRDEAPKDRI